MSHQEMSSKNLTEMRVKAIRSLELLCASSFSDSTIIVATEERVKAYFEALEARTDKELRGLMEVCEQQADHFQMQEYNYVEKAYRYIA